MSVIEVKEEHVKFLIELIDVVASRGAIKGSEMQHVGHVYNSLIQSLEPLEVGEDDIEEEQADEPSL